MNASDQLRSNESARSVEGDLAEVMIDPSRRRHSIKLIPFVIVMAAIEALNLVLTARLHFALSSGSTLEYVLDTLSRFSNILFGAMALLSLFSVFVSQKKTPAYVLPMMVTYLAIASLNVLINISTLVLTDRLASAGQIDLIGDLALIYASITLIFSLWYQLADVHLPGGAIDFPPNGHRPNDPPVWFDYLFLAFNTNSTFGPTSEGIRTRPTKALMMLQTSLALVVLVILVAKIIKN